MTVPYIGGMIMNMKNKNKQGFAPMIVVLLIILGIGIVGGGYFLKRSNQENNLKSNKDALLDSSDENTDEKPATDTSTQLIDNTETFIYVPDPAYIDENKNFKQDKDHVYFENKVVPGADPDTFQVLGGIYSKDKNNIFALSCWGEGFANCVENLPGADPDTFTIIADTLAKDSLHVFYYENILKDADPATIEVAGFKKYKSRTELYFIKDKGHVWDVFALSDAVLLANADPITFEAISYCYSKDKNSVYYFDSIISGADPKTFELFDNIYYAKDDKHVYYRGEILTGADSQTFASMGGGYFKDNKAIYAEGTIVTDVDYQSFKNFPSTRFSLDKDHVYVSLTAPNSDIVPNADPTTFTAISENYGKDKSFVYFKNRKVPEADPTTFRATTYVGLDKNHYYEFDNILNSPSESGYGGWDTLGVDTQ